jgi:hypothetical protein
MEVSPSERTTYMKPKAALVKAGLKPAGYENTKGRMSGKDKEDIARLNKENPDWNIEGFSNSPAPAPKATAEVSDKPKAGGTGIVDVGPPIRHQDDYEATITVNGKTTRWNLGMKGVCNNCRNSLTYCFCKYPVVNIDHETVGVITFKALK